ncbi:uncharacterized protein LOC116662473 isoform X1 [Camelus ferus]|uniref:Uncharacterized protein LOC116662473 isoform X1 n=1 Tax=Camelus ferus TaxID=419612 RepID=A0A8B8SPG5_CAMFR|nr:uncharacterized protein LOC116662473 isoform X1 [Camelus ferus]XP_032332076.1 uncharacterized protein LOC116662473 isoform X1 [Camelus ferus]XP_032332078.1 uncharacterized protein LOC116662473 isoform X1 [Camelus ferus]XP_032332079.1 uncharacterized protein LOC116662473 isoform X1 [Camelus ferus]
MVPGPDIGPWLHKKLGHVGSYTMRQVADQWGLHLSHSEAKDAVWQCPWCAKHHPHRQRWPQQMGKIERGIQPLQVWQTDYVGPFALSTGLRYLLTAVDTVTGLSFAHHVPRATQDSIIRALEVLRAFYGTPLEIQSDRGTPFTAQQTQEWAKENDINWILHVPYHPQAAGMIERYNGLLKDKLRALKPQGRGWNNVLPQAVHLLNEQPRHTGMSPLEKLLQGTIRRLRIGPMQDASDVSLVGHALILRSPRVLNSGKQDTWTWKNQVQTEGPWLALLEPWGSGLEKALQVNPRVGEWPFDVQVTLGKTGVSLLKGAEALQLWAIPLIAPEALPECNQPSVGGLMWYHRPGRTALPATVLSQDEKMACILPEGRDLPIIVSTSALSFHPG